MTIRLPNLLAGDDCQQRANRADRAAGRCARRTGGGRVDALDLSRRSAPEGPILGLSRGAEQLAADGSNWRNRDGSLTDNQERDNMVPMGTKRTKFSDQLRAALAASFKSRCQIARETGVDDATLCRFMHGKGGLSIDGLDRIADCLGLNLTTENRPPGGKSKGK